MIGSYNFVTLFFVRIFRYKGVFFLGTKFINGQNFSEIESINKKNNLKKFNKKLIRFFKRIPTELSRDAAHISKKFRNITWETLTPKKVVKGFKKLCFPTSTFKQLTTPRGIFNVTVPVAAFGVLVFTICFWVGGDYSINVSYDNQHIATISDESVLTEATAQVNNALSAVDSTVCSVTPKMQISYPWQINDTSGASSVYNKLVDCNDGVVSNASGLYVDGVFLGATLESDNINALLKAHLDNAKKNFDTATVTSFNNSVEVKTDVFATKTLMSAQELYDTAKSSLSVKLETGYVVTNQVPFETVTKYDDTQLDTYKKVITAGKKGSEKVHYNLIYIDGVQTDAVVKEKTVITEAVAEVVIVGTKESGTGSGTYIWPVPAANNISSLYEPRWGSFHHGIDIADIGIPGADIVASDTGVVVFSGWDDRGYGYTVEIDHGNGYTTLYAHCEELFVSEGEIVHQGDVIASVGTSGNSTGYHLHFEICKNGSSLNPCDYMNYSGYTTIYY